MVIQAPWLGSRHGHDWRGRPYLGSGHVCEKTSFFEKISSANIRGKGYHFRRTAIGFKNDLK